MLHTTKIPILLDQAVGLRHLFALNHLGYAVFKTLLCLVPLAIVAGALGGCAMTPPGYDPRNMATAHPPGHPDWDWYCPPAGYFPQVSECPVAWVGSAVGPTAKALSDEKRHQEITKAQHAEMQRRRTSQKQIADQAAARRRAAEAAQSDIARRGYIKTTVADLIIDFKSLPPDQKLYLTGFYNRLGTSDVLSASPTSMNTVVSLSMDDAPRAVHRNLLNCISQHNLGCPATFLVHTGCTTMQFGAERHDVPCVVLDDVKETLAP